MEGALAKPAPRGKHQHRGPGRRRGHRRDPHRVHLGRRHERRHEDHQLGPTAGRQARGRSLESGVVRGAGHLPPDDVVRRAGRNARVRPQHPVRRPVQGPRSRADRGRHRSTRETAQGPQGSRRRPVQPSPGTASRSIRGRRRTRPTGVRPAEEGTAGHQRAPSARHRCRPRRRRPSRPAQGAGAAVGPAARRGHRRGEQPQPGRR